MLANQILAALLVWLIILAPAVGETQSIQNWVARYDNGGWDQANDIAVDPEGNVVVTGFSSGVFWDYLTLKYGSDGQVQWTARYNGPGNANDDAVGVALDSLGNVFVAGYSYGAGSNYDFATIKYSPTGDQLWVARYSGPGDGVDEATALTLDRYDNVIVTGYSQRSGSGFDYSTIKYNAAGVPQWTTLYNGPDNGDDQAHALAVDESGNVYVTGRSQSASGGYDFATVKYDSAGAQQWVVRYNGPANMDDEAVAIAVDANSDIYVGGWSFGIGTGKDYFFIKLNPDGTELWQARYDGPGHGNDGLYAMALDTGGNLYATGKSLASANNIDIATIRFSSTGEQLWASQYDGPASGLDWGTSIALDERGNAYVAGSSNVGGLNYDYVTLKYDSSGVQQWVVSYDGPSASLDKAWGITMDSSGNLYVTGGSTGDSTYLDYATIKYSPPTIVITPDNPPIQIPATGGSFDYNLTAMNNLAAPLALSLWVIVQLPDQSWYGPTLGPVNLTLSAGGSLTRMRTQSVPGNAPTGNYFYEARAGNYPSMIWNSDKFSFTKLSSGGNALLDDWNCSGDEIIENEQTSAFVNASLSISYVPNPFNPTTSIQFELQTAGPVTLRIFDISGRQMGEFIKGWQAAGPHQISVDGSRWPSGIYFADLIAGNSHHVEKIALLR